VAEAGGDGVTASSGRQPLATAHVAPRPLDGLRGRAARMLYGLARAIAGTTPCPTCQEVRRRIGSGGRGAERRAWREAWKAGRLK
jgi:hypothetical protein